MAAMSTVRPNFSAFVFCFLCFWPSGALSELIFWNENPTSSKDSTFVFGCLATGSHKDETVTFGRKIKIHDRETRTEYASDKADTSNTTLPDDSGFPPGSVISVNSDDSFTFHKIYMPKGKVGKTGIFYCRVGKTEVISVINPLQSEADLVPDKYSITVDRNQTTELNVTSSDGSRSKLHWRHDNEHKSDFDGRTRVPVSGVEADAGSYETRLKKKRYNDTQAFMQLYVRNCGAGKWGDDCSSECPVCHNGGVCSNEGTCICAPGFTGDNCETYCRLGFFGSNCEILCNAISQEEKMCRGHFVCQQAPYGCSCVAGYAGKDCMTGCTQKCHFCKKKKCYPETGRCETACKSDRTEPQCVAPSTTAAPTTARLSTAPPEPLRLASAPTVDGLTATSMRVSWRPWDGTTDPGSGPVSGYVVWFRTSGESWQRTEETDPETTEITVSSLQPNTEYKVAVQVVGDSDDSNDVVRSPRTESTTLCGSPTVSPSIQSVKATGPRSLKVTWQVSDLNEESLQCGMDTAKFNITVEETMSPVSVSLSLRESEVSDLEPCTNYTIRMSVGNGYQEGPRSQSVVGRTNPEDPVKSKDLAVTVDTQTSTSLKVSWTKPDLCADLYNYTIRYKVVSRDMCPSPQDPYSDPYYTDGSEFALQNLFANTKYKVEVHTMLGDNEGKWNREDGNTAQAAPSGPPENINVTATSNTLNFTWDPPACGMRNGEINQYRVKFVKVKEFGKKTISEEKINATDIEFSGLTPYSRYDFEVQAGNREGFGPYSEPMKITTLESNPDQPTNLTVTGKTNTSVTLQWGIPERPNGRIIRYSVEWQNKENGDHGKVDLEQNLQKTMTFKMEGLSSFTGYTFYVYAHTSVGRGRFSDIPDIRTDMGVPSRPLNLQFKERGQTFITLVWESPAQKGGDIKYKIRVEFVESLYNIMELQKNELMFETAEQKYRVPDLLASTAYEISVCAFTVVGAGGWSDPIRVTTKIQAPDISEIIPPVIVGKVTASTLKVKLQNIESSTAPISAYKLLVNRTDTTRRRRDTSNLGHNGWILLDYYGALTQGLPYYITAEFIGNQTLPEIFIVGNEEVYRGFYNAPLVPNAQYQLHLVVVSATAEETEIVLSHGSSMIPVSSEQSGISPIIVATIVGVALVVLAIVIAALIIVRYQRELKKTPVVGNVNGRPPIYKPPKDRRPLYIKTPPGNVDVHELEELKPEVGGDHGIKLNDLAEYIKNRRSNSFEGFMEEYESLPQGPTMPHNHCVRSDNQMKNRYINIVTYDHSRVVLDQLPDDPCTDYINANFIDGYKRMNAYIATQGPNEDTTPDFWRMIWQENTEVIIMATNIVERGKTKCAKYWPDKADKYGTISVTFEAMERLADFIIRVFKIRKDGCQECRVVKQFHFTVWPDMGVPMYATAVLAFLKRVKASVTPGTGPIVVHCSAGVGRTGTFIVIDSMMDMMKAEGQVDIYNFVRRIRSQRINMVQTLDQYVFIYEAVLEVSLCGDTSITTTDYRVRLYRMKQINSRTNTNIIFQEFQNLSVVCPQPEPDDCEDGHLPENVDKNRFPNIIPVDRCRPYLMSYVEGATDYINASFVDGYKRKDAFLAAQMPLPNTVVDFWRLLYDYKSCSVVMLNALDPTDETLCKYWPDQDSMEYGPFTVDHVSSTHYGSIICRVFKLYRTSDKDKESACMIQQFHLTCWPLGHDVPQSKPAVIDLISLVEKWQQQTGNGPITVQCLNGLGRSGTFCAIYATIERMKVEQMIDVFQAVKKLRLNRPNMVQNLEQYTFCYDAAMEFLDSFDTYANFK